MFVAGRIETNMHKATLVTILFYGPGGFDTGEKITRPTQPPGFTLGATEFLPGV